jgi:hypothetical protein
MGYLFGQKRRKVGRLQRQAARCFLVTQEASSVELATWCWPRVVLIEKRPLTESERSGGRVVRDPSDHYASVIIRRFSSNSALSISPRANRSFRISIAVGELSRGSRLSS